jgi:hypothetical protein
MPVAATPAKKVLEATWKLAAAEPEVGPEAAQPATPAAA